MIASLVMLSSCKDFDDINVDPFGANAQQVQVEYFINNSIVSSQQDPHIAERVFVLYWKTAGRQSFGGGISVGGYNDGWTVDYYSRGYLSGWLSAVNGAITVAKEQIEAGNIQPYTNNLLQVARIWRVYLMSEMSDMFGPIPLDGFTGSNPSYSSVQEVYYFLLDELREASNSLDLAVEAPAIARFDPAYGYNFANWQKYANSMRMRLAMRLSEVDPAKAQSEFEAAATGPYIASLGEMMEVAERDGWDALTGPMTRTWNAFMLSATLNNLFIGLGGIDTETSLGSSYAAHVKPADYIGIRYPDHFTTMTNDPSAGYWLDGLPEIMDPRAYAAFAIPGDFSNPQFNFYPDENTARTTTRNLMNPGDVVFKTINAAYTWNAGPMGDWGTKGSLNQVRAWVGAVPRLIHRFRNSSNNRTFFAPWESYFLIAEAAVRGWNVPLSGQAAYEAGVNASFSYWGLSSHSSTYLSGTSYNRAGTSASWNHTAEPPTTRTMTYVNGNTDATGTVEILYPVNHLYLNGTVKNDHLTKIITQKFIAQNPYLPLETWSDHRRLGLPFFENPAIENPLVTMPALTSGNYMTSDVRFFPQRVPYPSTLRNNNPEGYSQAIGALGGEDNVLTPLWWAQK